MSSAVGQVMPGAHSLMHFLRAWDNDLCLCDRKLICFGEHACVHADCVPRFVFVNLKSHEIHLCWVSSALPFQPQHPPRVDRERERGRGRRERFILVTFLRFHSKCVHLNLYRKLCLSTCPPCCRIRWEIGQWLTRSCSTHAPPACKETRQPRMKTKYRAKTQHDHLEHWQSRYMTHPDFAQESPSVPADLRGSRWGSPLCVGKIVCVCVCVCLQLQQSMHFVHLVI